MVKLHVTFERMAFAVTYGVWHFKWRKQEDLLVTLIEKMKQLPIA
jgi:hypothetical protein